MTARAAGSGVVRHPVGRHRGWQGRGRLVPASPADLTPRLHADQIWYASAAEAAPAARGAGGTAPTWRQAGGNPDWRQRPQPGAPWLFEKAMSIA